MATLRVLQVRLVSSEKRASSMRYIIQFGKTIKGYM